uniref:Reverse transcriptase zinc-binding domain-containing protein n=1 Tax=Quercus lobata TaxID=97700 RepID=A0A7N2L8W6_QUELO
MLLCMEEYLASSGGDREGYNLAVSRVCDLFCTNTKTWDPSKLAATFYPWEAEMVSRVQVSEACDEDLLVWPFTTDGSYCVRSTYHFLALEEWNTNPSSSTMIEQKCLWKKLWKIWSPNKIHHFMWRTAKDFLSMKQNLCAQHVPINETCDQCGEQRETLLRSLWLCD